MVLFDLFRLILITNVKTEDEVHGYFKGSVLVSDKISRL